MAFFNDFKKKYASYGMDKLKRFPLFIAIDLAFFVVFAKAFLWFHLKVFAILTEVSNISSENLKLVNDVAMDRGAMVQILQTQQEILGMLDDVFLLIIGLVLTVYFIWTVFQGLNFGLVRKHTPDKKKKKHQVSFKLFFIRFAIYNAIAAIVYGSALYLFLKLSVYNRFQLVKLFEQGTINISFGIVSLIFIYLVFCGYILISRYSLRETLQRQFILPFTDSRYIRKFGISFGIFIGSAAPFFLSFYYLPFGIALLCLIAVFTPALSVIRFRMFS